MSFSALISKMITFVALMLVGYVGARRKVLDKNFARSLSSLVMNVFLSCAVINSVLGERPALTGEHLAHVLLVLSVMVVLAYALGAIAVRVLGMHDENAPIYELLISVMNTMFIGLPVIQSIYSPTAVLYCALGCIPFNVLLYSYGVWRLKIGKNIGGGLRLKDALTVPLIATFVALIIFAFDIKLPGFVCDLVGTTSNATMPVSMIVIGATLGDVKLTDAFREKRVYLLCLLRLIIIPAITLFVLRFLTTDAELLASCVIMAACPSAVVVTVLALQYDYDSTFTSKGVLATTVLSMVTLPLWAFILG